MTELDELRGARERAEMLQAVKRTERDLAPILTEATVRQLVVTVCELLQRVAALERGAVVYHADPPYHVRYIFEGSRDQVAEGIRALGQDPEP